MDSNKFRTMAQPTSDFGMPIYGSALGLTRGTALCVTAVPAVADRHVTGVQTLKGAFPGNSAWRPPTC